MSVGVIVLAAGKGTRMKSDVAKVLHTVCGLTLLEWALDASAAVNPNEVSVVVGHQGDDVAAALPEGIMPVAQEPQNGTGHAAQIGLSGFTQTHDHVVVLPGDMPLIRPSTLSALLASHSLSGASATVLTVELEDPTGYGRIITDSGRVVGIIEERDATPAQRKVSEVNTSVYVFDGALLSDALDRISTDNDQGEMYLTDVIGVFAGDGHAVASFGASSEEGLGVNSQAQLAQAASILRCRINDELLESGVWMLDPSRVYIDATVDVAPGAEIYPDTYLTGKTLIASKACIGPGVQIHDSTIGSRSKVVNAVLTEATVGSGASVGPFAYLRPGAVLADGSKAGAYVEVKNSEIGEGSKVPHLSYIGDTTIGRDTNIGAATVTVNYDGYAKHRTTIGDRVKIGADTMLIAPVAVGDDALTGAGSVITHDVPDRALGVERNLQQNIPDYADKRRQRVEGESD